MSVNFGIKQSFKMQSISRKFARFHKKEENVEENVDENVFENGNSFFVNNLQVGQKNSQSLQHSQHSQHSSSGRSKNMNAVLTHMKNYNRAAARSADHL